LGVFIFRLACPEAQGSGIRKNRPGEVAAMPATDQGTDSAAVEDAITRLEELGAAIEAQGWRARLLTGPGQIPRLRVQNPAPGAGALSEDIYCAPKGGGWHYWWSWAEPIAQAVPGEVPQAVGAILRVLRSADTP